MHDEAVLRVRASGVVAMLVTVGAQLTILGALAPVFPLYVVGLGASPGHWGLLGGLNGFLMILSEPVWGWLGDRLGFRRPYLLARLGLALGLWGLVWWPGLLPVVLWQVCSGLCESTIGVLSRGYIVRAYAPSRQTFGLSLYLIVYSACLAAGSTVGGYLFQQVGPQTVFICTALLGTLAVAASFFLAEPPPFPVPRTSAAVRGAEATRWSSLRTLFNGATLILGLAAVLQFIDSRVVRNFLVLLVQEQAGLDASAAGLLLGVFSLANVCCLTIVEVVSRRPCWRLSMEARIALGLVVGAAGMIVYSLARSFVGFLVAVTLDATCWALVSPARIVLLGRLSRPSVYGLALGLHGAFENVGVLVGPLLAGALWIVAGPAAPYRVTALLMAAGAVVALGLKGQAAAAQAARST